MFQGEKVLAIIPARGGSKGIPGKNIKRLQGKPLIAWTIQAAQGSKYLDKIIVSTDSAEIAKLANEYGAETPFVRPVELATDVTPGVDVILHTMTWFEEAKLDFGFLVLLQPTSPLRNSSQVDNALEIYAGDADVDAVVSVCEVEDHPFWMKRIDDKGYVHTYTDEIDIPDSRQELPLLYKNNGAIYICRWEVFSADKSFYKRNCKAFIMDRHSSIDLDTMDDWKHVEYLLHRLQK
jgi:CMP-N,N'-diacetyllegionaminic acid synthase